MWDEVGRVAEPLAYLCNSSVVADTSKKQAEVRKDGRRHRSWIRTSFLRVPASSIEVDPVAAVADHRCGNINHCPAASKASAEDEDRN
jgi:hypothetical protein